MTDFLRLGEYTPWGNSGTLLMGEVDSDAQPTGYQRDYFDRTIDFLDRYKWKILIGVALATIAILGCRRIISRRGSSKAAPPPPPEEQPRIDERKTQRLLAKFEESRPVPPIGKRPSPAVPPQAATREKITAVLFWNPKTKKFTMDPNDPLAGVREAFIAKRPSPPNPPTRVVMNLDNKGLLQFPLTEGGINDGFDQLRGHEFSLPRDVFEEAGITLGRDLRRLVRYLERYRHGI